VNIQLVSQNGQLAAQITTDSQQAKDALTKGIEALRQTLAEQGINVNRIVVNTQESSSENENNLANTDKEDTAFSQAHSKSHEQDNSAENSSEDQGIELADETSELPEEEAAEQEQEITLTGSTVDYKV
ncbi:MAG: flagellar hook-length control protein FliK, partial [Candidatus Gastranaerophilales bacterium]|nr:flagellar hook-length control protein FliK [Candidatus Gastranaerophilales bacterium]